MIGHVAGCDQKAFDVRRPHCGGTGIRRVSFNNDKDPGVIPWVLVIVGGK